jgi:monothiol glutaredoxin
VGILKRIKNRLPIVGGGGPSKPNPRPSASYRSGATAASSSQRPPLELPPRPPPPKSGEEVRAEIDADVKAHKVLLYMKGTPAAPQCGFSAAVADILERSGVPFETRDVVTNNELRAGVKEYTDWPTLPQIFIGHEFVGGCDILREMDQNGELKQLLEGLTS